MPATGWKIRKGSSPTPRLSRRGAGLTLVELSLVTLLFTTLVAVLLTSEAIERRTALFIETYISVHQEARRAFDAMLQELREAGNVTTPVPGQLRFQEALGYDLALPGCPPGDLCWGAKDALGLSQPNWSARYRFDAGNRRLVREALDTTNTVRGAPRMLAHEVNAVSFALENGLVRIRLEVRRLTPQLPGGGFSTSPVVLSMQVLLRN